MDIDFVLIGQRIRKSRQLRGMTADVLAERINLATESLRHIENASSKPSLQTLYRIAVELNLSLDYLTGRTPEISEAMLYEHCPDFGMSKAQKDMAQELFQTILPVITKYL